MTCINLSIFSYSINSFKSSRGINQVDLLSPYLLYSFQITDNNKKISLFNNKSVKLSHVMFADDVLITIRAFEKSCLNLLSILNVCCNIIGLSIYQSY